MNDKFKSTVQFFSNRDDKESIMNQAISSGLPVFARDIGGRGGAKTYMSCGYEHFCFKYYIKDNDRTRHTYELLQMDKPTKVYLDFDHSKVDDAPEFMESTDEFIKAVVQKLGTHVTFYVMEASTDVKLSRHVIFECFLQDVMMVGAFVNHVADTSCECMYLDRKVYTRNRLFRILYSYKAGKSPTSALLLGGDKSYNALHVFKTLIQAMLPPHYVGPFGDIKNDCVTVVTSVPLRSVKSTHSGYGSTGGTKDTPHGIDEFIGKMTSDKGAVLSFKENESFITCVVGGKKCPWEQRVHKSNNQYFTITKNNMRGFFQCADEECKKTQYGFVDVSCLWRTAYINNLKK